MYDDSDCHRSSATLGYREDCGQLQEQLHQLLTQLSGFALLILTRRVGLSLCAGPLDLAKQRMALARERFRSLRPAAHAAHHHYHLGEATAAIEQCVDIAYACLASGSDQHDRDRLTRLLRTGLDHLRKTERLQPGFAMVDLSQSCCAAHMRLQVGQFIAEAV